MLFNLASIAALVSLAAIPSTHAAQFTVTVGGAGGVIAYNPQSVNANPGDVVIFEFHQKNHTATQSTLANPCVKAANGFDSGFVPVPENLTTGPFPQAQFTVTSTDPVWVFCAQTGHCQQGMVFAINPGNQFAQFQSNAKGGTTTASSAAAAAATATTSAGSSSDHTVSVGQNGQLAFNPPNITAQVGDTVTFQFYAKNHTATQSSFNDPCRSLTLTSTSGQVGFDSGFMPVAQGATSPTYTIQVNNTSPIWVYCKQSTHCGQGMVFAVNAVESGPNNFEAFQAKAKQVNGSTSTSSSSGAGSKPTSGAGTSKMVSSAGFATALIAVVFGLFL